MEHDENMIFRAYIGL